MHRLDRTFTAGDIIRIFEEHLDALEQADVVDYFTLNFCTTETSLGDDLEEVLTDSIIDAAIDILTPDIAEIGVRALLRFLQRRVKGRTLRRQRFDLRLRLGLEGEQPLIKGKIR